MTRPQQFSRSRTRRLRTAGILGAMAATFPAWVDPFVGLDLPDGPDRRDPTKALLQQGAARAAVAGKAARRVRS
ncbi:MAG TPA: hypothetical protein VLV85_02875 [Stellaceae bacterium]|jgi:hypothetical protein|nr:hypothetical protein [Stellaceae bacterium]